MEDYDVVSSDDSKIGHAVGTKDGFLIVESGLIRKTKHAVPLDMTRTDADEKVVRLTVTKQMVEEGPAVEDDDTDWRAVSDYYGRGAELEGQPEGIEPSDQERAAMRDSLQSPDTDVEPAKGSVGIHQDRWEVKE